jgi:hypothetical protein
MRRTGTTWLAWAVGTLSAGLAAGAVVLAGRNGESLAALVFDHHAIGIVTALGLSVLGVLIASRRPANPLGWLMSVGALLLAVFSFTRQYTPQAVAESLPGVDLASWLATWTHPALPGRPAAVAPLAAGRLAVGRGHRGPGGRAGRVGLAGAGGRPGRPVLRPPGGPRHLRDRLPSRPRPVGGLPGRAGGALPPLRRGRAPADQGSPTGP